MAALTSERERRISNTEKVAEFFRAHVGKWIQAYELEPYGGRQAWRTRVSDCRKKLGMHIENRVRYEGEHEAGCPALLAWDIEGACHCQRRPVPISEYRYLDHTPLGRDSSKPSPELWPVFDAPIQETFRLT